MNTYQAAMLQNFKLAEEAFNHLSSVKKTTAQKMIHEIVSIKFKLNRIAEQKGYSKVCKQSIPVCKGECCKWQYPKNLTCIDFFISLFNLSEKQKTDLSNRLEKPETDYCPMLLKNGCYFSFEHRPISCTNAYPCFNDRSYWNEKEKHMISFSRIFKSIEDLLSASG